MRFTEKCELCFKDLDHENAEICLNCCESHPLEDTFDPEKISQILGHLFFLYKKHDAGFSRILDCLKKGYHSDTSPEMVGAFEGLLKIFANACVRTFVDEGDFGGARKFLDFFTSPKIQEFGVKMNIEHATLPHSSRCYEHFREFEKARKLLGDALFDIYDEAFEIGGWIYYDREGEDSDQVHKMQTERFRSLLMELHDCAAREERDLIRRELEGAMSIIALKTKECDFRILRDMPDDTEEELRRFCGFRFSDACINDYIEAAAQKYVQKSGDFVVECWKMLEYLSQRLFKVGIALTYRDRPSGLSTDHEAYVHANSVKDLRDRYAHHKTFPNRINNLIVLLHMNQILRYCAKKLSLKALSHSE